MPEIPHEKKQDPYLSNRHKFYASEWIVNAIDRLAELNKAKGRANQNRSELIANTLKKVLRANAARLRKAGVSLPEDLFEPRKRRLSW